MAIDLFKPVPEKERPEVVEKRRALIGHYIEHGDDMRRTLMRKTKAELVDMLMTYWFRLGLSRSGREELTGELMDEKRAHHVAQNQFTEVKAKADKARSILKKRQRGAK